MEILLNQFMKEHQIYATYEEETTLIAINHLTINFTCKQEIILQTHNSIFHASSL